MTKLGMLKCLPYGMGSLRARVFDRRDIDFCAAWPDYPDYYAPFNSKWRSMKAGERDAVFSAMCSTDDATTLAVDHDTEPCIGIVGLRSIDWDVGTVANMSVRLRADWCDRGVGTVMVKGLARWCFSAGIQKLGSGVCALNPRAVKCYENAGFQIVTEYWQDDPFWDGKPTEAPIGVKADLHLRIENGVTQVRFYGMARSEELLRQAGVELVFKYDEVQRYE